VRTRKVCAYEQSLARSKRGNSTRSPELEVNVGTIIPTRAVESVLVLNRSVALATRHQHTRCIELLASSQSWSLINGCANGAGRNPGDCSLYLLVARKLHRAARGLNRFAGITGRPYFLGIIAYGHVEGSNSSGCNRDLATLGELRRPRISSFVGAKKGGIPRDAARRLA
jgi:hypothetical protein